MNTNAERKITLTIVPCTECEPRTKTATRGRGSIEVPTSSSPWCGYEWIECPTCHGEGELVKCLGCGELWPLDQLGFLIEKNGEICNACE